MLDAYVDSLDTYQPNPWLSPIDVVKMHLDALQNSDLIAGDQAIVAAYNFASPVNKQSIGSVERFQKLLKSPLYDTLIGFERANIKIINRKRHVTEIQVTLKRGSASSGFYFTLSRQLEAPHVGCWMIDGVVPNF